MSDGYSRMTYNNRWRIKRWSHNTRFSVALKLAKAYSINQERFLDYGAGDGYFATIIRKEFPNSNIVAFDPSPSMLKSIRKTCEQDHLTLATGNLSEVTDKFDVIFCLEVLEHLQDEEIVKTISMWRNAVSAGGIAVISVPIETGAAGFVKNLIRKAIGESHSSGKTLLESMRATFGARVDRGHDNYIGSHFGFSHSRLRKLIESTGAKITCVEYSPIPWAGSINSQCFWVINW